MDKNNEASPQANGNENEENFKFSTTPTLEQLQVKQSFF